MAEAAAGHGAAFKLGVPIGSIDAAGGRVRGVVDAAGIRHAADAVCVVAGPWTDRLLKPLGASIGIRAERAQIAFFKRPAALKHCGCIDTISGSYFRPQGDEETLIGLGDVKAEYEPDPDSFREDNDADFVTEVAERLAHRVPAMAGAGYSRGHAGIYDISPDSRAVMGPVPESRRTLRRRGLQRHRFQDRAGGGRRDGGADPHRPRHNRGPAPVRFRAPARGTADPRRARVPDGRQLRPQALSLDKPEMKRAPRNRPPRTAILIAACLAALLVVGCVVENPPPPPPPPPPPALPAGLVIQPSSLAEDAQGNLWFTILGIPKAGRLDRDGTLSEFKLPPVSFGANIDLWV